jgi:hypothetical protein
MLVHDSFPPGPWVEHLSVKLRIWVLLKGSFVAGKKDMQKSSGVYRYADGKISAGGQKHTLKKRQMIRDTDAEVSFNRERSNGTAITGFR